MRIEYLADHPDHFDTVGRWIYGEWSEIMPYESLDSWLANFRRRVRRDEVPTTVLAFADGEAAGSASLTVRDLPSHMHLTPWLAEVFVRPEYRKQGIGSALVGRIEEEARRHEVELLFLYTFDCEAFYAQLGWAVLERHTLRGKPIAIMSQQV